MFPVRRERDRIHPNFILFFLSACSSDEFLSNSQISHYVPFSGGLNSYSLSGLSLMRSGCPVEVGARVS